MKVQLLGGCQIGASSARVTVTDFTGTVRNILIDSGVSMDNSKTVIKAGHIMPAVVDMIILTHGHLDHIGYAPWVLNQFPMARIMMTHPTVFIAKLNWDDTYKIMDSHVNHDNPKVLEQLNNFGKGLEVATRNLEIIEGPGRMEIFPGVFATFFSVGHVSGAMGILIEADGQRVLFTGDISFQDTPTIKGASLAEFPFGAIDAMFTDTTHGATDVLPRKNGEDAMLRDSKEAVLAGRSAFYAAFTIGRGPDVAIAHAEAGIDCYVDGATKKSLDERLCDDGYWCGRDIQIDHSFEEPTRDHYWKSPRSKDDFLSVKIGEGTIRMIRSDEQREFLMNSSDPKVIIASSGMLTGGWSVHYAERFLQDSTALVGLTGYQADKTPGRALYEMIVSGKRGSLELRDDRHNRNFRVNVSADIKHYNLSGHANASETIDMIKYLAPKRTFLVHGETKGREALKLRLAENGYSNSYVPQVADTIEF